MADNHGLWDEARKVISWDPPGYSITTTSSTTPVVRLAVPLVEPDLTDQEEIDKAVREAIEAPRRDREEQQKLDEIAARRAMVIAIGIIDDHEPGTVLRWRRRFSDSDSSVAYVYAAIKSDTGTWYVTGSKQTKVAGWTWEELLKWMLSGKFPIEQLEVATSWSPISE